MLEYYVVTRPVRAPRRGMYIDVIVKYDSIYQFRPLFRSKQSYYTASSVVSKHHYKPADLPTLDIDKVSNTVRLGNCTSDIIQYIVEQDLVHYESLVFHAPSVREYVTSTYRHNARHYSSDLGGTEENMNEIITCVQPIVERVRATLRTLGRIPHAPFGETSFQYYFLQFLYTIETVRGCLKK